MSDNTSSVDTGMFPSATPPEPPPIKLFPPSTKNTEVSFVGWSRTITFLTPWPLVYRTHEFLPMQGQDPVKTRDNRLLPRDRPQRAVCLGSPTKPFDGSYALGLDPEGSALCSSIKLPNGESLHDMHLLRDFQGQEIEWKYIFPVYVWEDAAPFVIDCPWTDMFVKVLLSQRAAHRDESIASFAVRVTGKMAGRAKDYDVVTVPAPGPFPQANPTDQRWLDVQRVANPFFTPEGICQHLGIVRYNAQHAPNSRPASPTAFFGQGPIGNDEDPFRDATPAPTADTAEEQM